MKSDNSEAMIAYVLGVPSRFRGEKLVKELQRLCFTVKIIGEDMDGDLWTSNQLQTIYDEEASHFFRGPCRRINLARYVACSVGHREIWRRIALETEDWSLVVEDDAELTGDVTKTIERVRTKTSWPPSVIILFDKPNNFNRHLMRKCQSNDDFPKLLMPPGGSIAYLMNTEAARIAWEATRMSRVDFRADWPHRWPYTIKFWSSSSAIFRERSGISTLDHGSEAMPLQKFDSRFKRYLALLSGKRLRGYYRYKVPFRVFVYQEIYLRFVFFFVVRPRIQRSESIEHVKAQD